MPKLIIDGKEIEVSKGDTILDAARKLGIDIPTLCFNEKYVQRDNQKNKPSTSCMVCIVKVKNRLIPSCATMAEDGMEVESETEEVHEARRTALELLLSDHLGDCIAPCKLTCPADMNIPLMIRQISSGRLHDAIATVKKDIALPAILGRICPAPCENACRRGSHDSPVSICLLKRYVADMDLSSEPNYMPAYKPSSGKRVAIVGAGPAGLSAAYYLLQEGISCIIYDSHDNSGGSLRYDVPEDRLPKDVLDAEIGIISKLGAAFRMNTRIENVNDELRNSYDAILIATGNDNSLLNGAKVDRALNTSLEGVFAAGNATGRKSKMAVRSVADGKIAALSIIQYISRMPVKVTKKPLNIRMGKLSDEEMKSFLANVSDSPRTLPSGNEIFSDSKTGFSESDAINEALRCLHCDCRKAENCKLRMYSEAYSADPNRYKSDRRLFEQHFQHPDIVYEPGKCIACGLCVQIASESKESLGLTFIGRGFDVRIGIPFNRSIKEGLQKAAAECVEACPTGAMSFKDEN